jgi:catechol 2,3-dioxygenase-like lactoylglutathione lyase family enzyme
MDRITHIGVLVRDAEGAIAQWSRLFNVSVVKRLSIPEEGVNSIFLSRDGSKTGFLIELIQPMNPEDPNNPASARLRDHGEGLFHIAMVEDDIAAARARLSDGGARFVACPPITDSGDDRLMVARKEANGVLVEVISAREWAHIWALP